MWKKTVTIDKSYGKECRALLRELGKNKSLVCAVEESKSRILISVAARDADGENAQEYLCDKITKLLTTYFKHLYITESMGIEKFTPAQVCLLAVMVYYDSEAEYAELFDKISGYDVICIDGVYNFAMKNLKEEWDELCVVSENLFNGDYEDEDLYDVAGYVVQEKSDRTRLLIADAENPVVTDVSKGGFVSVDDFYGDTTLDLINCAVGRGAKEVTLDASFKDKRLLSALSRFAKVRNI